MKKVSPKKLIVVLAIAVVLYFAFWNNKSKYSVQERDFAGFAAGPSTNGEVGSGGCQMKAGTGLASSLLPREVASQEDFGEFSPDEVLAGQNFLEPRQQVGYPETTGGALRNANQQIRADPPNPKEPFTWNNSTIAPDLMQRSLCA